MMVDLLVAFHTLVAVRSQPLFSLDLAHNLFAVIVRITFLARRRNIVDLGSHVVGMFGPLIHPRLPQSLA